MPVLSGVPRRAHCRENGLFGSRGRGCIEVDRRSGARDSVNFGRTALRIFWYSMNICLIYFINYSTYRESKGKI